MYYPNKEQQLEEQINQQSELIASINTKLAQHTTLEKELKTLKAGLKDAEKKKDELIEAARAKITNVEAKALIEARFKKELEEDFAAYIRALTSSLVKDVENLHNKYAVTVKQILAERDKEAVLLDGFMKELGYE